MRRSTLADQYLQLKAQQAELDTKEKAIKEKLLALNDAEIEGKLARVTISEVAGRLSYDSALLKKLVPASTLAQCEKRGAPSTRFNVKARISV